MKEQSTIKFCFASYGDPLITGVAEIHVRDYLADTYDTFIPLQFPKGTFKAMAADSYMDPDRIHCNLPVSWSG